VDYFSLDVEGAELDVLRTLPWDKVDIRYKYIFVSAALPVIISVNSCLRMCCNGDLGPNSYSMFMKNMISFVTVYCKVLNLNPIGGRLQKRNILQNERAFAEFVSVHRYARFKVHN
jgi:hypothetical protein